MICKKSDQHHTLLKRQIRAFLQTDLKKTNFEYFKNRVHYFFSKYSNIFRVSATGTVQLTPGLLKIFYMKIFLINKKKINKKPKQKECD